MSVLTGLCTTFLTLAGVYLLLRQLGVSRDVVTSDEHIQIVTDFYPDWKDVPWDEKLEGTNHLEIIVSYWGGWVNQHTDKIKSIFDRGGSIKLVLPSAYHDEAVVGTQEMFHDHELEDIRKEIELTVARISNIYRESSSEGANLDIYYYPKRLNYAAVRFDRQRLFFGFYEQFRESRVDSSAIFFNLRHSPHMQSFWNGEFDGFYKDSKLLSGDEVKSLLNKYIYPESV